MNPNVPTDLDFILKKALRHEPEERYASVTEFTNDIRAFLESRPVEARSGNAWYKARRYLRRHRASVTTVALVISSLAGGLYVANKQRLTAERRFNQLRQLSGQVLQLDYQLSLLPGATKVREQVVVTSKEYLAGLGKDAIGDDVLSLEIADAYLKVGRVQGVSWTYNLGQYEDGRRSLEQGERFAEAVLARNSKNHQALWLASSLSHDLGNLAVTLGDPEAVVKYNRQTAHFLGQLVALGNLERKDVNMAAYVYANLAARMIDLNQFDEAQTYAKLGVEVSREAQTIPGPKTQALATLAAVQRSMGDLDGAMESVRKARVVYENGTWDNELYHTQLGYLPNAALSSIYSSPDGIDLADPAAAAAPARASVSTAEALIQANASNQYMRENSAELGDALGMALAPIDPAGALKAFDTAISRAHELTNDINGQRIEAQALADSAWVLRKLGHMEEAGRRIDESLRLLRITKDFPTGHLLAWSKAETAQRALADHYAATGNVARAIETYQDTLGQILTNNPDLSHNLPNAMCVSRYWSTLAPLLRQEGRMEEAAALDSRRRELWRTWNSALPHNPVIERQLAGAGAPH